MSIDKFKEVHEIMQEKLNRRHRDLEGPNVITLKRIYLTNCQRCGKEFVEYNYEKIAIVYFIPLGNNLVCSRCAINSGLPYEPRIYKDEE